ncbi:Protein SIEVE ELEMENT OCCLUSION B [Camellia lanceoleosa]|uniref:Protein SIEVE ELEMENT OCCLUSION B n=1 Tax=Camellia lanceoleosa TaxID=1840588 RepID=A0ACC0GBY0_9ERIC|nr:Protein SIEVE ELEMENT OCCLUSION B [Camellia lanceoleosa]
MAAAIVPAEGRVHQARGDRHMFSTSDDDAMMKQIQTTHVPDGREVDVKPLICIIDDIMPRATPPIPGLGLPLVSA